MNKKVYLDLTIENSIANISLKRSPINAFSIDFLNEILITLKEVNNKKDVLAVMISSSIPNIFCAGLDLDILINKPILEVRKFLELLYIELWDTQYNMNKPTIAVIDGAARGGGMTLAISCDIIIASDKASFGYPEIDLGLLPAIHFNHLPKIVGRYRAFDLLFSGRKFDADEAFSMGLINKKVSKTNLLDEARKMASVFAQKSPTAIRLGRAAFMRTNDFDYRRGVANAVEDFCNVAMTPDAQEGLKAFLEKRKPYWK
ncbi:enoyl-CoA hydratase/isomerase family protein [Alphaproteobacteria bacterium]|jgi:enoyl-CoA hydratase|nr:enoyl-CoA hydratase/isomerase family protein [Alphaproteobacteria bacterium]|tara:strand:+ start:3597 stop:4373 length:777 start_codon:yes stop_codon:yes gene_type:complete